MDRDSPIGRRSKLARKLSSLKGSNTIVHSPKEATPEHSVSSSDSGSVKEEEVKTYVRKLSNNCLKKSRLLRKISNFGSGENIFQDIEIR